MPKLPLYEPHGLYHVYNRANGWEDVFKNDENCYYFLKKYAEKLDGVIETFAYCLMPNHFHLLIRVRSPEELEEFVLQKEKKTNKAALPKNIPVDEQNHFIVQRQFHNFLSGYAKAFNKYHGRTGSLFQQNTRRKLVGNESYLINALLYIHLNPVFHGFTSHPNEWIHCSYSSYLSDGKTKLDRKVVLDFFGGKKAFVEAHERRLSGELDSLLEGE